MAGYSGTPLPQKLGIKAGARVRLSGAPEGFARVIGVEPRSRGEADVLVLFSRSLAALERDFARLRKALHRDGGLWVAWPKKSSGVPTDLDENAVRALGLASGLVDNKVCAIDDTWSGLRFVVRLKDRG
ncbi:MAG TPA: hypothetical protein VLW85_19755 [Myxococcales bacterium]|nr:hypothetical protein [Myxococcales bacterium]